MESYCIENESQLDTRFSNKEIELIAHLNLNQGNKKLVKSLKT